LTFDAATAVDRAANRFSPAQLVDEITALAPGPVAAVAVAHRRYRRYHRRTNRHHHHHHHAPSPHAINTVAATATGALRTPPPLTPPPLTPPPLTPPPLTPPPLTPPPPPPPSSPPASPARVALVVAASFAAAVAGCEHREALSAVGNDERRLWTGRRRWRRRARACMFVR
jgi:hypothetical protein